MLEKGDLLTLSNEKEYLVINQIKYNGKHYLYLVSKDGISEVAIFLYESDTLTSVDDPELIQKLLEEFKKDEGK